MGRGRYLYIQIYLNTGDSFKVMRITAHKGDNKMSKPIVLEAPLKGDSKKGTYKVFDLAAKGSAQGIVGNVYLPKSTKAEKIKVTIETVE